MPDSEYQRHHQSYEDDGGSGLLWRTARNAALLLAGCLLVWGILKWGGEQVAQRGGEQLVDRGTEPALDPSQDRGLASVQIAESMATDAEIVIPAGRNGHFLVTAEVEDVEILFLVDTGASQIILTVEDAERLGHNVEFLEFSDRFQTANGTIRGAPLQLTDLRIGDMEITDLRASVIQAPMSISLLGMSFLSRLEGYEVGAEGLILHW